MVRIAIIDKEKCNSKKCNQECIKYCPVNRTGKECIVLDSNNKKAKIEEVLCTGCGICVKRCPFDAISIINLPEVLKKDPLFRYGPNSFELFRLPIPKKGKVVGILGANGIGKSTALEILSNLIKINFGNFEKETKEEDIIRYFRGSELQDYFKKLFENNTKVSYKPQYIDLIPKKFKETAEELLLKNSTKKEVKEVSEKFGFKHILSRKLEQLSGGELQKIAIAATAMKDADIYFFDEPSSFLDIKERIKIAKIINELAEKGKAVVIIEHDLIILDYLSEIIHILFGKKSCYGVVSHPLSSKNGINTYLDGFLKDENIRFRDEKISFRHSSSEKKIGINIIAKWPEIEKKLSSFKLTAEGSEIYEKEIVGVIGANGIGKTTLLKIIAGQLKADKGKVPGKLKISYKEQYISPQKNKTVREVLSKVNKNYLSQKNKIEILAPLEIESLFEKKLEKISGGELQRVAIAVCLLQDADLYLLDEPSNYLDIEQRLRASRAIHRVIKNKEAAGIVIDHDLLFINYLSDRILSFDGEPAVTGRAKKIANIKDGMNSFLKELNITLRNDEHSKRPRVNKINSQKDKEQRKKGIYYA